MPPLLLPVRDNFPLCYWRAGATRHSALRPSLSRRPSRTTLSRSSALRNVYVFNLEGVLGEEGGQTYATAPQLLGFEAPYYIISGLEDDQAVNLLRKLGLNLPKDSPQIFLGTQPSEVADVLRKISQRPVVRDTGARLNLVSSNGPAIKSAKQEVSGLQNLRIYLAGWSPEGIASKKQFDTDDSVVILEEKQLHELLSWGLIMGVDDGCGDDN